MAAVAFATAFGCGGGDERSAPATGTLSAPIHSVTEIDHDFPAVGLVTGFTSSGHHFGCSGTLIADRVVLTASHCLLDFAQGCQTLSDALKGLEFIVYPSGDRTLPDPSANRFPADGIAINPSAIALKPEACASAGVTCATASELFGLELTRDVALVHLATSPTASLLAAVQLPRVVTSIASSTSATPDAQFVIDGKSVFGGGSVKPHIVGWGFDDLPCPDAGPSGVPLAHRHSGFAEFGHDVQWNQSCSDFWTCAGTSPVPTGTPLCPFSSPRIDAEPREQLFAYEGLLIDRGSVTFSGTLDGPVVSEGDSGSPLVVDGDALGIPEVAGARLVLGVLSAGGTPVSCGFPFPPGVTLPFAYAPTFQNETGAWIHERLRDFDGDGIPDPADNCPTVANYNRANANRDAERALGKEELGNACDPTPTTSASLSSAPVVGTVPCTPCSVGVDGSLTCGKPTTCPKEIGSLLRFDSWIGNTAASATPGTGTSLPAFCPCTLAVGAGGGAEACADPKRSFGCVIANDKLLPGGGDYKLAVYHATGWNPTTQFDSSPHDQPYSPQSTLHQQSGDLVFFVPTPTETIWDFFVDFGKFNAQSPPPPFPLGSDSPFMLWSIVDEYPGPAVDPTELPQQKDLSDSYLGTSVLPRTFVVGFPDLARPSSFDSFAWALWHPGGWAPFERGADEGPPFFALPTLSGDAFPISQTMGGRAREGRTLFDPSVLKVLADVSSGKKELLIGDDVVAGIPQNARAVPAIVVSPGNVDVSAAFQVQRGRVLPKKLVIINETVFFDPVRAYDALDATLFYLDTSTKPTSLAALDVASSFFGTPVVAKVTLLRSIPAAPIAMVWHGQDRDLFVLDRIAVGRKKFSLRLLRILPSGVVLELWRTHPAKTLPKSRLSVSPASEIVLSLDIDEHAEVLTLDVTGAPRRSLRVEGTLLTAAIGSEAGISLPLFREPEENTTDLDLRVVHRGDMTIGLCASRWLLHHVDRTTVNPLNTARSGCIEIESDDGHDEAE